MGSTVCESHESQYLHGTVVCFLRRYSGDKCGDHHILQRGKLRQKLMKLKHKTDILIAESGQFFLLHPADYRSVNRHRARIRFVKRSHDL